MNTSDTIVALSTPRGRGGLGVVRLSGSSAAAIAAKLFKPSGSKPFEFNHHTSAHGWISFSDRLIDEVVVACMRAPNSYTGEDVVEITAHGGPVVLDEIISACAASGARHAAPGEYTLRAFLHGKMDLSEAEAVADLISSRTALAAGAAIEQLRGGLSERVSAWKRDILGLLAPLEAGLDHSEDGIEFMSGDELAARLGALSRGLEDLMKSFGRGRLLRQGLRAVITGRPNSGKSSLMNALLERERAIVTDLPGTTRDILEETLDLGGLPVVITDTAGLGEETGDAVEKIGRERAAACLAGSDLVLWLVDSSAPVSADDRSVYDLLCSLSAAGRAMLLLSKSDLRPAVSAEDAAREFPGCFSYARVSSASGAGLKELEKAVMDFSGIAASKSDALALTNERHRAALAAAGAALKEAAASAGGGEEIISLHLREALSALGEITGETATEEILDRIFSEFCIGK